MKRIVLSNFILVLSLLCTGCTKAKDPENLFEMQLQGNLISEEEKETESEKKNNTKENGEKYQYGNMQKNAPPGDFMSFGDQILFLNNIENKTQLFTYDKISGEINFFCRDATCKHNSSQCVSAGATSNIEQYNGNIYALDFSNQIVELKDGHFEQIADGAVYNFWHANNQLYAVSRDCSLVVFEDKKPRILIDEYTDGWNVVFEQYLYGCSSKGISRVDLSKTNPQKEIIVKSGYSIIDGEHIYYMDNKTFYLYRCNMDGSDSLQLIDQPVLPASINFDEEYLYYRLYTDQKLDGSNSHDLYRIKKEEHATPEKIAELKECVYTIYTVPEYDSIFVLAKENFSQDRKDEKIYVVSKDGSSIEELQLPDY